MAAISLLVLLIFTYGAQTRSTQTEVQTEIQGTRDAAISEVSTQLDVSAELNELKDMVVELRVTLQNTQYVVKSLEGENVAVKGRLVDSETKVQILGRVLQDTKADMKTEVDNLKKENAAQETEMAMLKTRLTATETEVMTLKKENSAQEAELTAVKTRLAATEAEVEDLKTMGSAALGQELVALKTRLAATESAIQDLNTANDVTVTEVKDLKMDSAAHEQELAALKTRLAASETAVGDLKIENAAQEAEMAAVKTTLAATETEVDDLEKQLQAAPKVAFSAGLRNDNGYIEAGSNDLNLAFSKVITSVGQAYNSTTGFFTAPVKGVYYFRFSVMDDFLNSRYMKISMHKNGKTLLWQQEYETDGKASYLSNGMTVRLEKGDVINMVLPKGGRLYDYSYDNSCSFSGFLLFPL